MSTCNKGLGERLMAYRIVIGLSVLAFAGAGLAGCQDKTGAPATAQTQAQAQAPTAAEIEAASQAAYQAGTNAKPRDPVEAFVWTVDLCSHLGGEIGGDGSAHDVQVQKTMTELDCGDGLVADGQALKVAHASDPAAVARIDAALKAYADAF
jgi:hypothetical protein